MQRYKEKNVIVSGGGTGIGRAIAHRFAKEGATLGLLGRREGLLQETVEQLNKIGSTAHYVSCDIQDKKQVESGFKDLCSQMGGLDIFIANAGIGGANEPGKEDRFDALVQTNLNGTYYCLRAAQKNLKDATGQNFVLVSSCLARFGVPGYTGYCASKSALLGLGRALALELAPKIRVNCICPGWVDTQMARDGLQQMAKEMGISTEEAITQAMSYVPSGRMSKPEEIAGMVAWLCSSDAAGITGQAIDMNGGSWMG
jgi:NAD(P)-dependent dehydrogenase (short-subunit alcohol dehydrogenase family)